MDSKLFGQFVAQTRKDRQMTQADLAAKIGVTDKAVSRWERGIGFPDINTLEPLANALDLTVLELMRSRKSDKGAETDMTSEKHFSKDEVAEIMTGAAEMARESQKQDKMTTRIGGLTLIIVAFIIKLTGRASLGGAILIGGLAGLIITGIYLMVHNRADSDSRKIYSFFILVGTGIAIPLLLITGVDDFLMIWIVYGLFAFVLGLMNLQ